MVRKTENNSVHYEGNSFFVAAVISALMASPTCKVFLSSASALNIKVLPVVLFLTNTIASTGPAGSRDVKASTGPTERMLQQGVTCALTKNGKQKEESSVRTGQTSLNISA